MAGILFDEFRLNLGGAPTNTAVDLNDSIIGVWFVDEGTDTINQTTDVDCADRTGFNPTFANAPNLAGAGSRVTMDTNIMKFDAADLVFTAGSALTGSTSVESLELWIDTGTNTTSSLISNHDDYTGLPLTPSGTDVTIVWPATGIIRI